MQSQDEVIYRVRKWDMESQKVQIINVTLDQMVKEPTGLNMSDVGVILLNQVRGRMGLAPINEQVAGALDETTKA
jgi:hypothetical protein